MSPIWRVRAIRMVAAGAAALVLAALVALWLGPAGHAPAGPGEPTAAARLAGVGGPFSLVDQDGRPVTDRSWPDHWLLVYFGFTFCPDICPTELGAMTAAIDRIDPAGGKIQPIFISIDPDRDTPAQLKSYVALFHPRLVGLTGTAEAVDAAARAYRVYYAKSGDTTGSDYTVDHSSFLYLVAPDGTVVDAFPQGWTPDQIGTAIEARIAETEAGRS